MARAHDLLAVAHTHGSLICCFASAFVPNSDEKRDGGRAFPSSWKADSVSPLPARIALQGGERAGAVAICLSTPATKTCRRGPRLPLQEKSDSGNISGQSIASGLGD
jgi:hypothetical protein